MTYLSKVSPSEHRAELKVVQTHLRLGPDLQRRELGELRMCNGRGRTGDGRTLSSSTAAAGVSSCGRDRWYIVDNGRGRKGRESDAGLSRQRVRHPDHGCVPLLLHLVHGFRGLVREVLLRLMRRLHLALLLRVYHDARRVGVVVELVRGRHMLHVVVATGRRVLIDVDGGDAPLLRRGPRSRPRRLRRGLLGRQRRRVGPRVVVDRGGRRLVVVEEVVLRNGRRGTLGRRVGDGPMPCGGGGLLLLSTVDMVLVVGDVVVGREGGRLVVVVLRRRRGRVQRGIVKVETSRAGSKACKKRKKK